MGLYIVSLIFKKPFRIGSPIKGVGLENGQSYINSDTIFSALVNVWNKYKIIPQTDLEAPEFYNGFLISSAFPFTFENGTIYYLPTPKTPYPFLKKHYDSNELQKLLKQHYFLPSDYVKNYFNDNDGLLHDNRINKIREKINFQYRTNIQRMIVNHLQDRIDSSSKPYYKSISYNDTKKGGLYFLIRIDENLHEWTERFNEGLLALTKEGLGGERTYYGKFIVDEYNGILKEVGSFHPLNFLNETSVENKSFYSISLYYPQTEELKNISSDCFYDIIIKKGWVFSTATLLQVKRKDVPFFVEGSVFNFNPTGKIVDAKPNREIEFPHPVWRWGKAFTVGLGNE